MDKYRILSDQLGRLEKKEKKFLGRKNFLKSKTAPVTYKIQEKLPKKLKSALDGAFYSGFRLVFEKGAAVIEKTYDREKLQVRHDFNDFAIDSYKSSRLIKRHVRKIDRQSGRSRAVNGAFSMVEGVVLGLFGVGIPDVPLFLAVMVRTINETALSYGFGYDTDAERVFTLYLICGAMSEGEKRADYDRRLELLGGAIDAGEPAGADLDEAMRETSDLLSETILASKVIQSLPVVGLVGAVANPFIINRVWSYAGMKYKKRYLLRKLEGK